MHLLTRILKFLSLFSTISLILVIKIVPVASQRGSTNNEPAENIYILTVGGERSQAVYAFEPNSYNDIRVPDVSISRKAGAAAFYDNKLVACGGISEEMNYRSDLDSCEVYEEGLVEQSKPVVPKLPYPLQYFKMIVYRKQLLVVGGVYKLDDGNGTKVRSNEIWKYIPASSDLGPTEQTKQTDQTEQKVGTWEKYLYLETPRSSHDCQIIYPDSAMFADITKDPTEDLYCFGGLTDNGRTDQLEIYEQDKEKWFKGPKMSMPRSAFASTSFKTKIYVTGGKNDQGQVENTVDIYDIRKRKWEPIEQEMTVRRYYHTSFYSDGYLFLRGGTNKQDSETARKSIEIIEVNRLDGSLKRNFVQYHHKYEGKSLHNSILVPRTWLPNLDPDRVWEPEATPRYSGKSIDEEEEYDSEKFGYTVPTKSSENSDLNINSIIGDSLQKTLQQRMKNSAQSQTDTSSKEGLDSNLEDPSSEIDIQGTKEATAIENYDEYDLMPTDETGEIIEPLPTDESGNLIEEIDLEDLNASSTKNKTQSLDGEFNSLSPDENSTLVQNDNFTNATDLSSSNSTEVGSYSVRIEMDYRNLFMIQVFYCLLLKLQLL